CGDTRGGIIYTPASTSSATASPDSSANNPNPLSSLYGRYLDTRSRRGRARYQGTEGKAVHSADLHLPSLPTPHVTQFRFHNTLTRPIITATVTISFSKEIDPQAPLPRHKEIDPRELSSSRSPKDKGDPSSNKQQMLGSKATHKDKGIQTEDNASGGHAENTCFEEYGWCPVMEEEPTEDTLQLFARLRGKP
ncbi:Hypothetical predicted protein, partial [Olea europaea subsp. europaea]